MNACSLLIAVACLSLSTVAFASGDDDDNPFNAGRSSGKTKNTQVNVFNQGRAGNFNDFRVSLNAEYARMIKEQEWREHQIKQGQRPPDRDIKPVPPIKWNDNNYREEDREVKIDEVVSPIKGGSRAQPIAPVVQPEDNSAPATNLTVNFLGTPIKLHAPSAKLKLNGTSPSEIADAWTRLSQPEYATLVADCIKMRQQLGLCDWAYMVFLESVARAAATDSDAVAILITYLASQTGYNVRLATTANGRLDMMYASQHLLYNRNYTIEQGVNYYPYFTNAPGYRLCQSRFKNETGLSLWIPQLPIIDSNISDTRVLQSNRYSNFRINSSVNKNLISFYDTYPTSKVGSNPVSRWAMYANTPVSDHVRQNVYPQLRQQISGLSQLEAVERILNWIQTAFVYEYDDKVWGGDRAFFPEESLYYPFCDCEDRSILFTRLIRDLIGLKCLLIFYPGHLAAAVHFPSDVNGDYILHNGKKFTVTDPTYIGAPVGRTMPDMDNAAAKIILLD